MMSYANFVVAIWVIFGLLSFIIHKYHKSQQWKVITFTSKLKFTNNEVVALVTGKVGEEDFMGRGGSGIVFRGTLGGQTVAVKKFYMTEENKNHVRKAFEAEVTTLGALRHSNIITLLVSICNSDLLLLALVYEFMENGSLDQWLHNGKGSLAWPTRLSIAINAANGLSYMHDFMVPVIHRDIKSSNILLDYHFEAKIGDFGFARILSRLGQSELVSEIIGTHGYIAPEYARDGKASEKADVYGFGVVLLELTTGKQPHSAGKEPGVGLVKWASEGYTKKVPLANIIDKTIQNHAYLEAIKAVFKLGLRCTSENPLHRPAMDMVLQQLLLCVPSRDKHRGKKQTLGSFGAKVYNKIRNKIFS